MFKDLIAICFGAIEPSIGADFSWAHLFLSGSEQSVKGVAISIEVVLREPSVRNTGRAYEPPTPL